MPYYIAEKILSTNTIVIARGSNNPALFRKEAEIANLNFIEAISDRSRVMARVRYRQPLIPATLIKEENDKYKLIFSKPVKFVAPGQSAVFYEAGFFAGLRGRKMVGGGIIL